MGVEKNRAAEARDRKRGRAASKIWNAEFVGYINPELTEDEKETYDAWAASEGFWEALEAFPDDGINLSLKKEPKTGGFLASGTQRRPDSPNAGFVVTARGGAASTALGRLLFTLKILSHYEKWSERQKRPAADRW